MTRTHHSGAYRLLASLLALQLTGLPGLMAAAPSDKEAAQAAPPSEKQAAQSAPPARVTPNRTLPRAVPPPLLPSFSKPPLDAEIYRARVFDEPFVPAAGARDAREDSALSAAILEHVQGGSPSDLTRFEAFLRAHPQSRWTGALLLDMGIVYRRTGYFTRALDSWEKAWTLLKGESEPHARALADRALGELAELNARLGRYEQLEALFTEIATRDVRGPASQKLAGAREGFAVMQKEPERAFLCGPFGIDRILARVRQGYVRDPKIDAAQSTRRGTTMAQMLELAASVGLKMQVARRTPGAEVIKPALVHWKAGHFAALVEDKDGRLLLQDPTFGDDLWITRAALDDQASGFFLVPEGKLPAGWDALPASAGADVWGKGITNESNNQAQGANQPSQPPPCPCQGMAGYTVNLMLVNLRVSDTPVGYQPPLGPPMSFGVAYNQREVFQPQLPMFSNFGPKWTFDWFSFAEDDPTNPAANVSVYLRKGGQETYTNMWTGTSPPHFQSRARLVRTSSTRYERRLPDGSVEVFGQSDGSVVSPRRLYLTQILNAQGNHADFAYSYESASGGLQLVSATDAIGQVTSFRYDNADPLKVTRVTDPFGRFATFEYDGSGRLLRITDVLGLTSEFTYGPNDFISSLTTPYGTTSFATGQTGNDRWLETTDPLGAKERFEYLSAAPIPGSESVVPAGMATFNAYIHARNTFYWDKRATAEVAAGGPPYSKAHIYHWLHMASNTGTTSAVLESEKLPLERRVWFNYPGQGSNPHIEGTSASPTVIGRVLDDGTTQLYKYEYNAVGKMIHATDPVGRETRYTYGANNVSDQDQVNGTGIDLLKVEQLNGTDWDPVKSLTYNARHQPLTVTDPAGELTTYTYLNDDSGRLWTLTSPARIGHDGNALTLSERSTTYEYYPDDDAVAPSRLKRIIGPSLGSSTGPSIMMAYDARGRVQARTDTDGYAVTMHYDALDRMTKTTYPDGSYEEIQYDRLDAARRRDRLGRWSHAFRDPLRRVTATRDPLGRVVTYTWCSCGSLDSLTDPAGRTISWERDLQGRIRKETRPDGNAWSYTYESTTSRLKAVTDAKQQTKTYSYDLDDKQTGAAYTPALVTSDVTYQYRSTDNLPDPYGHLLKMSDGAGTTTYEYYPVGVRGATKLKRVTGPANDVLEYGYDELGRIIDRQLNGTTNEVRYAFDSVGRLRTELTPVGTFAYGYDGSTSRLVSLIYPNDQRVDYAYYPNTGDHRLQEVHNRLPGGDTLSKFGYASDALSNILTWSQQRGSNAPDRYSFEYDRADQLRKATLVDPAGVILHSYGYAYDSAGNRTVEAADSATATTAYNNRNQITSQVAGGAIPIAALLSEPGAVSVNGRPAAVSADNRVSSEVVVSTGTQTVIVTATDPSGNGRTNTYQTDVSGMAAGPFSYDANGNLISDGVSTYEWDAENRLIVTSRGGVEVARFAYGADGRRVQRMSGGVVHTYLYAGQQLAEERLSTGGSIKYIDGSSVDLHLAMQDQSGTVSYFSADHLGTVNNVTTGAGSAIVSRAFDPWGEPLSGGTTSGYAFTGRDWEAETGLYYYRARYYDPKLGRFLNEDPLRGSRLGLRKVAELNPYVYVRNNPINRIDPSGLISWKCIITLQTLSLPLGGGIMLAACWSECVGGKSLHQVVTGPGAGGSLSIFEYGGTAFPMTLNDPFAGPTPYSLPGFWSYAAIGGAMIGGAAYTWGLQLGAAYGQGPGWQAGIDLGIADAYSGFTVPIRTEWQDCYGTCPPVEF